MLQYIQQATGNSIVICDQSRGVYVPHAFLTEKIDEQELLDMGIQQDDIDTVKKGPDDNEWYNEAFTEICELCEWTYEGRTWRLHYDQDLFLRRDEFSNPCIILEAPYTLHDLNETFIYCLPNGYHVVDTCTYGKGMIRLFLMVGQVVDTFKVTLSNVDEHSLSEILVALSNAHEITSVKLEEE